MRNYARKVFLLQILLFFNFFNQLDSKQDNKATKTKVVSEKKKEMWKHWKGEKTITEQVSETTENGDWCCM